MPVSRAAAISARDIAAGSAYGAAVGRVVQVMEFADGGVAGLEHLDVQLRGDGVQRVGIEARGEAVHRLAPGPERVLGIGLALGEAGHRALERVRMQVGDAGHDPVAAAGRLRAILGTHAAGGIDVEAGVAAASLPKKSTTWRRRWSACRHSRPRTAALRPPLESPP